MSVLANLRDTSRLLECDALDYDLESSSSSSTAASSSAIAQSQKPQISKPVDEVSQDELVKQLEGIFLSPPVSFSDQWLNLLQTPPSMPYDTLYHELFDIPSSQTRSTTHFIRAGLDGRIVDYEERTSAHPLDTDSAKNSSSFTRAPAAKADFVRGRAGFVPFTPGGLDPSIATSAASIAGIGGAGIVRHDEHGLLNTAPGLPRGLNIATAPEFKERIIDLEESYDNDSAEIIIDDSATPAPQRVIADPVTGATIEVNDSVNRDLIDDLLPTESIKSLLESPYGRAGDSRNPRGKEWAHVVDVNTDIVNFSELVPKMAREWPFELDNFQKEAVYHLEQGDSVFVAAHTSAGKTVVAEYAIAMANRNMTKAIYTSPIKALSNQKFRDFRHTFDDVGILTGDVQINPQGSCVIMTTEILRSMLYKGADLIRDVEFVIFDEVHYVNDVERGVVWEEVIIMLPDHVKLILLSATVPNTLEFASWVGRTKKKDIYVISTPKRPIPLEHYLWAKNQMFKIVDANKKFLMEGWSDADRAVNPVKETNPSQSQQQQNSARGGRGGASGRGNRGGSSAVSNARVGRGGYGGRGGSGAGNRGGKWPNNNFDKTMWLRMVQTLYKMKLQPVVIFVFSKKRCEEYANSLSGVDYCNASERAQIHIFIENAVSRLRKEDQTLPQIMRMRELMSRGIAVHHGGLLPIVKEAVEILFSKSLVKVLFATETFSMGLNLPTRTVVFSGTRKHDGRSFRDLLPGEYTQMAGRAGRRGLDTIGTVIIAFPGTETPNVHSLNQMILGPPTKLQSQFRLTYNMILNLLRVEALKVEEMIKRSFNENASQQMIPEHEKNVKQSEATLRNFKREECDICDADLQECHDLLIEIRELVPKMIEANCKDAVFRRTVDRRLAVVQTEDSSRTVCVIMGVNTLRQTFRCYGLFPKGGARRTKQKVETDLLPCIPELSKVFSLNKSGEFEKWALVERDIPFSAVECITVNSTDINLDDLVRKERTAITKLREFLQNAMRGPLPVPKLKLGKRGGSKNLAAPDYESRYKELREQVAGFKCLACKDFVKHFAMIHEESLLKQNILELKQAISDQNLELLPEYEQRIEVLKDLGFIDDGLNVELKGRVACDINSGHELIITELILENFLADYEPEEIVALLSCFVFQEKSATTETTITPRLDEGKAKILEIATRVNEVQEAHQVVIPEEMVFDPQNAQQRFGLMEVVYEWARGMPFSQIIGLTDVLEGTIVHAITRLDEVCREVKTAARIIGDPSLHAKMELSQEKIKRDIVFCTSLYL
ncbi:NUC185 domain-containing protein [Myxozyma melibiosi]|uniref:NUC185 domain-containing protein n=1 Tax=Myxozyma melibiosi TaxID=54550 RepID=A0ABR1F1F6_9ASCO